MNPWARLVIPGTLIVLFVFLAYLPPCMAGSSGMTMLM